MEMERKYGVWRIAVLLLCVVGSAEEFKPNAFADTYNLWVARVSAKTTGTMDVREIQLYRETKHQWHLLEKTMDEHYKQEGYTP